MKKILLFNLLLAMTFVTTSLKAADGDVFTAPVTVIYAGETQQVTMRFQVTSESDKTCSIYATYDEVSATSNPAIYYAQGGEVIIPEKVNGYTIISIGSDAFHGCYLERIKLPETIKAIYAEAFEESHLQEIDLPSSVAYIGDFCFAYCSRLISAKISGTIENGCFYDCPRLEQIEFKSPVTSVGVVAFTSCTSLRSITFPSGLKTIDMGAFGDCKTLAEVTLPSSTESIKASAFWGCTNLRNVVIARETPPTIDPVEHFVLFADVFSSAVLHVPDRTKYTSESWASNFSEIKSFLPTVEQTTTYARCYINGSSEYNALGLFMGSNDAIKNILDLNIDGVPQMPVMENSYLILTDNLKNIPLEVSYVLKTDDGIQPYIHHYHQVNYGISINGKQMTSVDMYNIPCLKSGKAHFEDERSGYYWANKPTLVLENATLECDGSTGVDNGHYGSTFNIKVVGDCTISGKGEMFNPLYLDSETSTTIKGGGTLNLISANESGKAGDAIYSGMEARLTLTDYTTLIATSIDNSGYWDEGEGRFTIDSGYFCAYSEKSYPLWLPSQFLLGTGIECRYPVGGQVWGNYVYGADGAPVQGGWVMFGYDTQVMDELITGVSPLGETEEGAAIYNLAGQRLNRAQKGIYITNGRKVLVK